MTKINNICNNVFSVSLAFVFSIVPFHWIPIIGSIVFLFLPYSSNLLYVGGTHGGHILGLSCTTSTEWLWIATCSALIILPQIVVKILKNRSFSWLTCWSRARLPITTSFPMQEEESSETKPTLILKMLINRYRLMNVLWFIAALGGPCLWNGVTSISKHFSKNSGDWQIVLLIADITEYVGAKAAWPAMWNLAIIVLPVQRIVPHVMHYCYFYLGRDNFAATRTNLVALHMQASTSIVFWIAVHAVLITIAYLIKADYSLKTLMWQMLPLSWNYTEGVVNFSGWAGSGMLLGSWISSHMYTRQHSYEGVFKMGHNLCAIGFFLFSNLHDYNTLMFAWPGFLLLMVDFLLRFFSFRYRLMMVPIRENHQDNTAMSACCLEVRISYISRTPSIVRLTISPPKLWWSDDGLIQPIQPGKHIYLRDKTISSKQWHPFTISSINRHRKTFDVHIKDLGDWTASLVKKCDLISKHSQQGISLVDNVNNQDKDMLDLEMEGPFGPDLSRIFDQIQPKSYIFVAGGIGLTGLSEAIQVCCERGYQFSLIWLVRSKQEMDALGPDLLWNQRFITSWSAQTNSESRSPPFHVFVTANDKFTQCSPSINEALPISSNEQPLSAVLLDHDSTGTVDGNQHTPKPTVLIVSTVVAFSMAVSFLIGRQLCCYQSDTSGTGRTCGIAHRSSITTPCQVCDSLEDTIESPDGFPCCKITICYLCFRALPLTLVLFLTPVLAIVVLTFLTANNGAFMNMFDRRNYQSLQELVTVPGKEKPTGGNNEVRNVSLHGRASPIYNDQEGNISLEYPYLSPSVLVSIKFERPDLDSTLESFRRMHEGNHISSAQHTTVLVCGPHGLMENVRQATTKSEAHLIAV